MFYLEVPDIDMSILDIEDSTLARLKHFATFGKVADKPKYVEYLRNSSILDYAGFLCLRTHASLTDDYSLKDVIIEGECYLISERLSLLKSNYMRKYLIKIIEDIERFSVTDDNIDVLLKVCLEYKNKQHVPCDEHCTEQSIQVPWQQCPTLVSDRRVCLIGGIARVPCNQWNALLVDLFRLIYVKSLRRICRSMSALPENNLQVEYLSDKINEYYYSKIAFWRNTGEEISLEKLNINKQLLPPCMLMSLNSLFTNHRLAHNPRYQLTLFLREIGVPLDQTLMLFKQEYSKPGNLGSTCIHTWEQHNKKLEYYVRHTYGLLGTKKIFPMTSCAMMQKQNNQVSDEGCCPFVHCSENKLKVILEECTSISDEEMQILNYLRNEEQPIRACHWYAHKLFRESEEELLYHNRPTEYFFNLKKNLGLDTSLK